MFSQHVTIEGAGKCNCKRLFAAPTASGLFITAAIAKKYKSKQVQFAHERGGDVAAGGGGGSGAAAAAGVGGGSGGAAAATGGGRASDGTKKKKKGGPEEEEPRCKRCGRPEGALPDGVDMPMHEKVCSGMCIFCGMTSSSTSGIYKERANVKKHQQTCFWRNTELDDDGKGVCTTCWEKDYWEKLCMHTSKGSKTNCVPRCRHCDKAVSAQNSRHESTCQYKDVLFDFLGRKPCRHCHVLVPIDRLVEHTKKCVPGGCTECEYEPSRKGHPAAQRVNLANHIARKHPASTDQALDSATADEDVCPICLEVPSSAPDEATSAPALYCSACQSFGACGTCALAYTSGGPSQIKCTVCQSDLELDAARMKSNLETAKLSERVGLGLHMRTTFLACLH